MNNECAQYCDKWMRECGWKEENLGKWNIGKYTCIEAKRIQLI
jgi:hypothetical protein